MYATTAPQPLKATGQTGTATQQELYAQASALAPAIARLARSVERDRERARDLEQDMHLALWRSLAGFDGRCALSTWTYRVIHNVAAAHATRDARAPRGVALEELADAADNPAMAHHRHPEAEVGQAQLLARIHAIIAQLHLPDRSIMLLYLEGVDAATIAEITGVTPNHVAVKIHRIKAMLYRHFNVGDPA